MKKFTQRSPLLDPKALKSAANIAFTNVWGKEKKNSMHKCDLNTFPS